MLLPNLPSSLMAVCSLGVVAYCFDYSSIHSSGYFAIPTPGSSSGYGNYCLHIGPVVATSYISPHTVFALLSFVLTSILE